MITANEISLPTGRANLRRLNEADVPALYDMFSNLDVMRRFRQRPWPIGTLALLVGSSALASNEGAAIGAAFAEIMNYAAVYIATLLLALTALLASRRSNRKWYIVSVVGAAVTYVLLLVIIVYSNNFQLYKSFPGLYYGAIAINCMVPVIFYIREHRIAPRQSI